MIIIKSKRSLVGKYENESKWPMEGRGYKIPTFTYSKPITTYEKSRSIDMSKIYKYCIVVDVDYVDVRLVCRLRRILISNSFSLNLRDTISRINSIFIKNKK